MVLVYGMADSCLYNKQNNTWTLGDMEFIFECSHRYRTSERSDHVLFSIYVSLLPLELEKLLMNDKITASCQSDIFHKHFIKC